jgi:hypothetical protein
MHHSALFVTCLFLASSGPVSAQRAALYGTVRDSVSGNPVGGADVSLVGEGIGTLTTGNGHVELNGVASGVHTIVVRRVGFQPGAAEFEIALTSNSRVDMGTIMLLPVATELDPILVEAEEARQTLHLTGFLQRQRSEKGTFITFEDIDMLSPERTSELIRRIPGFRVARDGSAASARGVPSIGSGFSACMVNYYIDGVHSDAPNVDVLFFNDTATTEIYTGSATTPPAFRVAGNAKCGVIAIWTKSGGRRRQQP